MQNWGRLGYAGYIGMHDGGVDVTLHTHMGLVVNTVTPGSPTDKIGLCQAISSEDQRNARGQLQASHDPV